MTVSPEVHLDTQVLVWLFVEPQRSWPAPARLLLNEGRLRHAPMARLELCYLFEIVRIKVTPEIFAFRFVRQTGVDGERFTLCSCGGCGGAHRLDARSV